LFYVLFFFSSRRRHTRFSRDWSSDVCSSDLQDGVEVCASGSASQVLLERMAAAAPPADPHMVERLHRRVLERGAAAGARAVWPEIGRASCRERGEVSVAAGARKTK